jgi:S-adenosylmethionine decarboxylase
MEHLGRHVIIELWGCSDAINNSALVQQAMRNAVDAANATLLNIFVHEFSPQGVTGVAVLAESHLSIHTWPEYGYVAADVFTCGSTTKPEAAAEVLRQAFGAETAEIQELERGVMPKKLQLNRSREFANA